MITTLIVTLGNMGESLIAGSERILGSNHQVRSFTVDWDASLDSVKSDLSQSIAAQNEGDGVLLLTDVFGSTSTNVAMAKMADAKVEVVTGVNLPMVMKAMSLPPRVGLTQAAAILRDQSRRAINVASDIYR